MEICYFWRVDYLDKIGHNNCTYFDKFENIDEYLSNLSSVGIKFQCSEVKLKYHHMAKQRGYCSRFCRLVYAYEGRFGKGVKVYIPNTVLSTGSTRYHYVKYYVYG